MTIFSSESFPKTRLRRNRKSQWIRDLTAQTTLCASDLILPLFVHEGKNREEKIPHLSGVSRLSIDLLVKKAKEAKSLGIPALMLFPAIEQKLKTADGKEALNEKNLVCRAIAAIKNAVPEIGVIADVALDPYTSHGHDGLIARTKSSNCDEHLTQFSSASSLNVCLDTPRFGSSKTRSAISSQRDLARAGAGGKAKSADGFDVLNDATIEILCQQALVQAAAGCDIVAPSDMMDGRVGVIRDALDDAGFVDVGLVSYAAKYASNFYGPFRHAVGSAKNLKNFDKKTYQMDFRNSNEALREIALDVAEGADMIIIKPGMPYLDVVKEASQNFKLPIISYQVSGEYAMLKLASGNGLLDFDAALFESLIAFKRAGASAIISYGAIEAAKFL